MINNTLSAPFPLPVTFSSSPLPSTFSGTPQQFLDAIVARLSINSQDQLSFFTNASVAPSSNVGPWLNGQTWYVWDDTSGTYIPLILTSQSKGYIAQQLPPDPTIYTFWIKLDSNGNPLGIYYYYSQNWVDIYSQVFAQYSTTEQVNQILQNGTSSYPARMIMAGSFGIPIDTNAHKNNFDQILIDPNSCCDAGNARYIAKVAGVYSVSSHVQLDNNGGTPASMEISIITAINGNPTGKNLQTNGDGTPSPTGQRWYVSVNGLVQLNVNDYIEIWISADDTVNTGSLTASNASFDIFLVAS